jgi:hypothetical protein
MLPIDYPVVSILVVAGSYFLPLYYLITGNPRIISAIRPFWAPKE